MKHLKLFFALFAMLALGVGNAWAETVEFTPSNCTAWNSTQGSQSQTIDGITLSSDNAANNTQLRLYSGGKHTISSTVGNITSIVFTCTANGTSNYGPGKMTGDGYVASSVKTGEWTGNAASVTLNGGQSRCTSILVTYTPSAGGEDPGTGGETPTPDPGTGGETTTVTYVFKDDPNCPANATDWFSGTIDQYTGWTATKGGSNNPKYYTTGTGLRVYNGGKFTITSTKEMTSITLTFASGSYTFSASNTTNPQTVTPNTKSYEWSVGQTCRLQKIEITYTADAGGSETPAPELTDAQFAWSAATAEATMGASNTFPTLTNGLSVPVTYESSTPTTATIDATSGAITLVAPGTTTISAKFAGGEVSGTTYAAKTVTYALTVLKAPAVATGTVYVKVTDAVTDGEYLIVYEDAASTPQASVAFNGSLETLDVANNTVEVAISENKIAGNTDIDAATFTINVTDGTILSASGKYIGKTANSNGLDVKTTAMTNTFAIDADGNAVITGNTAALRYNKAADQKRFRYYKDGGGSQEKIALYKKASSHTLTYGTCTNGSVSADVADGATVLSRTTITLTATPATDYKLSAYDVYKTGDETTKVTVTDGKFVMPEYDVTISATFVPVKTLTSIEITTAATQTTFWQGETFNSTGLEVTAHFDGAAEEVVTPTVTGSTATAGTQTVTISFTEGTTTKTTEYDITVKATANTTETAYDVATAREIIDKVSTANDIYVQGIVSKIVTAYNSTYGNITYDISADGLTTSLQLQAFRGKSFNGDNFTSANDVKVGDEVVVFGNLLKYNSTYELAENNKLISLNRNKAVAGLAYETKEYTAKVNEAFSTPVLTNPNSLTVTYSSSDENLATVDATTGAVTILDRTGTVTITATFAGDESYLYGTASYNITISDPNLTEATFNATVDLDENNTTRGEGSIAKSPITFACTDGVLGNGSEYRIYQNAAISFTAENGYAITKVVITSTASGTSQYGPGHLTAEEGTYSYSDKTGTWVGEAQTVTLTATAQSRAKLITVYYKTDNRQEAGIAWSTENLSITLGDSSTAPTLSNPNGLIITCTSDNENLATVTNAGVVTLKSGVTGKATITAKFDGNSNYKDAIVTCTIIVNPKTETVVILAEYNGQWYALKNVEETTGKVLAALPVNYVGGKLYNVKEADKATIEWQRAAVTDGIIFKNGENYIYGTAGSTDLKLSTTECAWTLDGSTYKIGNRTFIYRAQANGFKNYNATTTPGTDDYSNLPVVTAPEYATGDIVYTRTVTNGEWGTICLPYASSSFTGATFYEVSSLVVGQGLWLDQLADDDQLVAGKPYIFQATATEIAVTYTDEEVGAPVEGANGLTGTFTDIAAGGVLVNNYIIAENKVWVAGSDATLPANRAYIDAEDVPTTAQAQIPGRRRVRMGENEATGFENITTTDKAVKIIENGQLIIIRNGEKFNAQGVKF